MKASIIKLLILSIFISLISLGTGSVDTFAQQKDKPKIKHEQKKDRKVDRKSNKKQKKHNKKHKKHNKNKHRNKLGRT